MKPAAVILAAGLGTRMKSSLPKVLHPLFGKTLVQHVAEALMQLGTEKTIVVTGRNSEGIRDALRGYPVSFAVQKEPRGTGDALKPAVKELGGFGGTVVVVSGDTPLVKSSTLKSFLKLHKRSRQDISLISFIAGGPHSYGRIIRSGKKMTAIVEDKNATEEQKKIREVNSGIYAIERRALGLLDKIPLNKIKHEYYLTDLVALAVAAGFRADAFMIGNERELTGINTREDLYNAAHYMRAEIISGLAEEGVRFVDKSSVFISPDASVCAETTIYPNVHIEGKTSIGRGCVIYPNSRISASSIGDNVIIKDSTLIESAVIGEGASVGPFAHIRPGSVIGPDAKIGNFVEVKKSVIGSGTKASHLSYLGDAEIGDGVNIGAGTITCNYDGKNKHKTVIGSNAFIGSDTQFVAPVSVGEGAYVGAGSTITEDIPPLALAISRAPQQNIEKWALKRQKGRTGRKK